MRVSLRSFDTLSEADLEHWRELAARAAEPNPFFEPEFVLPAARHIGGAGIGLVVAGDDGGWSAALPVQRRVRPVGADARLGRLPGPCVVSWCHTHCFLGTPLLHAERTEEAAAALLSPVARSRRAAWFGLPYLAQDGPAAAALGAAFTYHGLGALDYERFERAKLERRPEGGYLENAIKPKHRRELARQRKLLTAEAGELVVRDRAGDDAAVERFLDLEDSGWKHEEGTSLRQVGGHAAFLTDMVRGFASRGRAQLLELSAGDRIVAMKLNLLAGDGMFTFKIAFDEAFGRYSPGVQLEVESVEAFHSTLDAAWADSCAAPDNTMINRLWPGRRAVATALVPTRTALGGVARAGLRAAIRKREQREEPDASSA